MFRSGVFHCTCSNGICHTGLLTTCEQDQKGVPSWFCSQAVSKPVWHILLQCVQWKTPDDGQRNCPKLAEFYSKNKFEKLVHLVGFIIRTDWLIECNATSYCDLLPCVTQNFSLIDALSSKFVMWWLGRGRLSIQYGCLAQGDDKRESLMMYKVKN